MPADPREPDRPAHVRAASGLAWWGERLVAVQDDALWLVEIEPASGRCAALALPAGASGERLFDATRGNKAQKPDLEACFAAAAEGWLVGVGSGSTPARRRWLRVGPGAEGPRWVDAFALYAALERAPGFAGGALNLEGAALLDERLWLLQRGNGAPRSDGGPFDATCSLPWAPLAGALAAGRALPALEPEHARRWELGGLGTIRLSFTDVGLAPGGALAFLAAAEDSPDAIDDGAVVGSVLGRLDLAVGEARWAPLQDARGPLAVKAEGLALHPSDPRRAWVVLDPDDPTRPAELLELALDGPWW